jgi:hypothetical protein
MQEKHAHIANSFSAKITIGNKIIICIVLKKQHIWKCGTSVYLKCNVPNK